MDDITKRSASIWIPDAALVCAVVTLFYCLVLYDGWRQLFRDSDSGWHIRAGEQMLMTHSLPQSDPYSFSRPNAPWMDWEWGADVVTALAHRGAGLAGVAALYAALIAVATWLWFGLTWAAGGDFFLAWLFAVPLLSTTNLHWLARPHIFSWCCALLVVILIESPGRGLYRQDMDSARLVALAGISILWANLHASFLLLPAILIIYAAGEWISASLFTNTPAPRTTWLLTAALITFAASFANPYGYRLHLHVLEYLGNTELLDRIGEFQTFNFHAGGSTQILAGLGVAATGGVLALTQGRVSHFLLTAALLAAGLRSARALPLVALLLLPLANRAITQALDSARTLKPSLEKHLNAALTYSANLRNLDQGHSGLALTPIVLAILVVCARAPATRNYAGFPPSEFPVDAVKHIPANATRILAPDKYGGYLIYASDGRQKVYFDGRSDFYGAAFMKHYIDLVEVRPNWQDELERQQFTHALLPVRYSLVPALKQRGWRQLYNDEVATILER